MKEFSLNGPTGGSATGSPRLGGLSGSRSVSPQRAGGSPPNTYSPPSLSPRLLSASTSPRIGASASPLELPLVTSLELAEKLRVLRAHQRGNLTFIGELFKQRMLPHSVVHLCLDALLDDATSSLSDEELERGAPLDEPDEADVEAVCTFMGCVGAKLEAAANGTDEDDEAAMQAYSEGGEQAAAALRSTRRGLLDGHFRKILALSRCSALPSRFRFMLQDLLDLRARAWVPRMQKTVDPKSLTEIREANSGLLTPQHGHGAKGGGGVLQNNAGKMTSARKPMGGMMAAHNRPGHHYGGGGGVGVAHTSMKAPVSRGGPSSSSSGNNMGSVGRVLHFGNSEASPLFKRSISAPDVTKAADAEDGIAELPPEGRYVPVWQRKKLGLAENFRALLPRSVPEAADNGVPASDAAAANGAAIAEAEGECEEEVGSPRLLPEELTEQLSTLLDEMFSAHDVSEAMQCLGEVLPHAASPMALQRALVPLLLSKCVEQRSSEARALAPALLLRALSAPKEGEHGPLLSSAGLLSGLEDWVALLPDVAIDTPHAPSHSASVLAALLHAGHVRFDALANVYASAAQQDLVSDSDASDWALEALTKLPGLCSSDKAEEEMLALVRPSASASATDAPSAPSAFVSLFAGDVGRARAALEQRGLSALVPVLL